VPITAVFLVLFMGGAATHMTIFQLNRRKGHKFLFSAMLFGKSYHAVSIHRLGEELTRTGFCMARIATSILRIASTCLPNDIPLAIAAQIFVAAGVVIVFGINLVFAQRITRAQHPHLGWHKLFSAFFPFCYALIAFTIVIVITAVVQTFYTLDAYAHFVDRRILLYGVTTFAVISFLPIALVVVGLVIPRRIRTEKFGSGRFSTKIAVLLTSSTLICLGASYRAATQWLDAVPMSQPLPAYLGKGPFYVFNFTVEILTVYLYAYVRVDRRFHIPNGAKGPGAYTQSPALTGDGAQDEPRPRVYSEEETFDDEPQSPVDETDEDIEKGKRDANARPTTAGSHQTHLTQQTHATHDSDKELPV